MRKDLKEKLDKLTPERYSNKLTISLLERLYNFLESDQVKNLEYFCDYDKAAILTAIEIIEKQEQGLEVAQWMHRAIMAEKNRYV